jgi:hypothetical protein
MRAERVFYPLAHEPRSGGRFQRHRCHSSTIRHLLDEIAWPLCFTLYFWRARLGKPVACHGPAAGKHTRSRMSGPGVLWEDCTKGMPCGRVSAGAAQADAPGRTTPSGHRRLWLAALPAVAASTRRSRLSFHSMQHGPSAIAHDPRTILPLPEPAGETSMGPHDLPFAWWKSLLFCRDRVLCFFCGGRARCILSISTTSSGGPSASAHSHAAGRFALTLLLTSKGSISRHPV